MRRSQSTFHPFEANSKAQCLEHIYQAIDVKVRHCRSPCPLSISILRIFWQLYDSAKLSMDDVLSKRLENRKRVRPTFPRIQIRPIKCIKLDSIDLILRRSINRITRNSHKVFFGPATKYLHFPSNAHVRCPALGASRSGVSAGLKFRIPRVLRLSTIA